MASYVGFFNTLSTQGITQGNVIMNYQYENKEGALKSDINKCDKVFENGTDQYNYSFMFGQGWCNCQHCAYNCSNEKMDYSMYIKKHGVLDGLDASVVAKAGLVATVLLLFILLVKCTVFSIREKKSDAGSPMRNQQVARQEDYFSTKA